MGIGLSWGGTLSQMASGQLIQVLEANDLLRVLLSDTFADYPFAFPSLLPLFAPNPFSLYRFLEKAEWG